MLKMNFFKAKLFQAEHGDDTFPERRTLQMKSARSKEQRQFTQIDQDHLHHLISKWSLQKPEDKFFFRPHSTQGDTNLTDTDTTTFENDRLDDDINDDIDEIRPKQTPKSQNNLLFCYQSEQQQRLLARYGSRGGSRPVQQVQMHQSEIYQRNVVILTLL